MRSSGQVSYGAWNGMSVCVDCDISFPSVYHHDLCEVSAAAVAELCVDACRMENGCFLVNTHVPIICEKSRVDGFSVDFPTNSDSVAW